MCRELTCSKRPFNPLSQFSTPGVRVLHRCRKRLKVEERGGGGGGGGGGRENIRSQQQYAHYALCNGVP